ncbi:hypothetical protein [Mangrovibacillus cuniculi]|uniref:Branched-chain amino acid aminotransferase n=1 Tax=Mangrovibacillus cuniculi TaxID=2593652 RepID=A0A7S8HFG2_9BACI|nr:hypothetical protein [Mangrovibacillus cuniculi]QPC46491.1 hypothetical protein G8O30_05680 [Mangrovibacillus cuniculi]
MLKKRYQEFLSQHSQQNVPLQVSEQEYNYVNQYSEMNATNLEVLEKPEKILSPYVERVEKETEETVKMMDETFLQQDFSFLYRKKSEYVYIESKWFDVIAMESLSIEVDDVFNNIELMFGLRLQKKKMDEIKSFLTDQLSLEKGRLSVLFNGQDGLFDINISLETLPNYQEEMSFSEILSALYDLLFTLHVDLET